MKVNSLRVVSIPARTGIGCNWDDPRRKTCVDAAGGEYIRKKRREDRRGNGPEVGKYFIILWASPLSTIFSVKVWPGRHSLKGRVQNAREEGHTGKDVSK